jgi:hypothetical protein
MPLLAYFDANVFDHVFKRTAGVTQEMVDDLRTAVRSGVLRIPASVVAAEEILATVERSPLDAFALGALYFDLVDVRLCVKPSGQLLTETIRAYAQRSAEPTPYLALTDRERKRWQDLAAGGAQEGDVTEVVEEADDQIKDFLDFMRTAWPKGREVFLRHKKNGGKFPSVDDLWPGLSVHHAEAFAIRAGAIRAVKKRGLKGLLARRRVLAAAGAGVGLIYAQVVAGRKPDRGDSRDLQHVIMAAAVRGPFVTHDKRLAKSVRTIPGRPLEVLSLAELLTKV